MNMKSNLPTIAELFEDNIELAYKQDQLNQLLNAEPRKEWVKEHPFVKNWKYIPIDKIEFMLRKIFKEYSIEILREGQSFNGVYVTVRVHYLNPATGTMNYHDGIGACQLQTAKGTSPADLSNINNGALSMAFPIAKTLAVKDACDHFGRVFGSDLNRKDTVPFTADNSIKSVQERKEKERIIQMINSATDLTQLPVIDSETLEYYELSEMYNTKLLSLKNG